MSEPRPEDAPPIPSSPVESEQEAAAPPSAALPSAEPPSAGPPSAAPPTLAPAPPAEARAPEPSGAPAAIELRALRKRFGAAEALRGVDLVVPRGEIFGFLGPNGAGKTTTLRILATLAQPSGGYARVAGFDVVRESIEVRRRMGYLPDGAPAMSDFTVGELLEFFASAYGISGDKRRNTVRDVLALVELSEKRERPISTLSLGMRQRLGLARVLLHDPEVLLLDEPGTGLDPRARVEIREVLRELCSLDKTILISSHILGELNELCTSIGILEQGRLVFSGSLEEAKSRVRGRTVEVRVEGDLSTLAVAEGLLAALEEVEEVSLREADELLEVSLAEGATPGALARVLLGNGLELSLLRPREIDLEDAFLSLTEGKLA